MKKTLFCKQFLTVVLSTVTAFCTIISVSAEPDSGKIKYTSDSG